MMEAKQNLNEALLKRHAIKESDRASYISLEPHFFSDELSISDEPVTKINLSTSEKQLIKFRVATSSKTPLKTAIKLFKTEICEADHSRPTTSKRLAWGQSGVIV